MTRGSNNCVKFQWRDKLVIAAMWAPIAMSVIGLLALEWRNNAIQQEQIERIRIDLEDVKERQQWMVQYILERE